MYVCSCDQIDYFSQESYKKCTWYFRIMVLIKMIIFKTDENAESVYYLFQISKMITKQIMRRLKEHLKQGLTTKRLLCTNRKISFCKIWNFKKNIYVKVTLQNSMTWWYGWNLHYHSTTLQLSHTCCYSHASAVSLTSEHQHHQWH